jgi:hypothetical protein
MKNPYSIKCKRTIINDMNFMNKKLIDGHPSFSIIINRCIIWSILQAHDKVVQILNS